MSEKTMPILEAIAILDGALTITDRIVAYLNEKRMRGELTPEEEQALDERQEKMFAGPAWQIRTPAALRQAKDRLLEAKLAEAAAKLAAGQCG